MFPKPRHIGWLLTWCAVVCGCRSSSRIAFDHADYQPYVQQIEYPDAPVESGVYASGATMIRPPSVRTAEQLEYWPMTLEEAVQLALANSETIRESGGRIVSAPTSALTIYDPAIQEVDPRTGPEAALAAFDAQFSSHLFVDHREREFNNRFLGAGSFGLTEQLGDFNLGFHKTAATGTKFSFENTTLYDYSNSTANVTPSVFDTVFEAGFRHPLLQGAGVEFNRIAGPQSSPGNYRGILVARINSDVKLVEFEAAVRNLLYEVERSYWELEYSYRDLDTKLAGRKHALESWQLEKQRVDANKRAPDREAYTREQFYAAQSAVENALSGGGGRPGVVSAEGKLRSLLGLPAADGWLIRPNTPPVTADVRFDWEESLYYSLTRRVELRGQRWLIKRRELELVAARNFERMRLDFIGQYRWRGFGDDLMGQSDSAFNDLLDGHLQGWFLGLELNTPIGNRVGHAAARHAELLLQRDRAVLREQERQISHELRNAFVELDRAYVVTRSSYNRHVASQIQLKAQLRRNQVGTARLDLVLEAQRQAVAAEIAFHRALLDYSIALSQLHRARGTLLDSIGVYLTEGPWTGEAQASAAREARRFAQGSVLRNYVSRSLVSAGPYSQRMNETIAEPPALDAAPLEAEPESGLR
jgi:outer membrane protein TolC